LVQALRRVPIYGPGGGGDPMGSAENASYSVAISDAEARERAQAAAAAKEAARLMPSKPVIPVNDKRASSPTLARYNDAPPNLGLTPSQDKAIDELNSRDPANDAARDDVWDSKEDGSTLGERPSMSGQDAEAVKGVLRRESTKGKRRPGQEALMSPTVPTISETLAPISSTQYAQQAEASLNVDRYEQQRTLAAGLPPPSLSLYPSQSTSPPNNNNNNGGLSLYPTQSTSYAPQNVSTSYNLPAPAIPYPPRDMEMRQMSRSPSNPYRSRSESVSRKPLSPTSPPRSVHPSNRGTYDGA